MNYFKNKNKMKEKKYIVSESQIKTIIKNIIKEQGLYGDNTDVVDYDLPEYLSDVIILSDLENFNDVERSIKELHKRLIELEKGLDHGGQHQKAFKTGGIYSDKFRKYKDLEKKEDSVDRDEELRKDIENLRKMMKNGDE
jgi:hypothetical protein